MRRYSKLDTAFYSEFCHMKPETRTVNHYISPCKNSPTKGYIRPKRSYRYDFTVRSCSPASLYRHGELVGFPRSQIGPLDGNYGLRRRSTSQTIVI